MKILIVSYYFPPFNAVGAIRAGKMAKYLYQMGHDVRVISADNQIWMPNLPVEIDEKYINRTKWLNINKPIESLLGGSKNISKKGFQEAKKLPDFIKTLGYWYRDFINFPDAQIGWYPFAMKAGKKLLENWKPDFIWASSSPPTSLLVARKLSKYYQIPWIADLRDLWADNHNAELYQSKIRRLIDSKLEKWVLKTANALVTISEPLAEILRNKFNNPIAVITNGYDQTDYPKQDVATDQTILNIVYTGTIYPKKDDFNSFFEALALLGEEIKKIKIHIYGRGNQNFKKIAAKYGVAEAVQCHELISYSESLQHQINADILLLLIHNSPKEAGSLPAKFFEYLGARKRILLIGYAEGAAANIIRMSNRGVVENSPTKIAEYLIQFLLDKNEGRLNSLTLDSVGDFTRQKKAEELIQFLTQIKNSNAFNKDVNIQ